MLLMSSLCRTQLTSSLNDSPSPLSSWCVCSHPFSSSIRFPFSQPILSTQQGIVFLECEQFDTRTLAVPAAAPAVTAVSTFFVNEHPSEQEEVRLVDYGQDAAGLQLNQCGHHESISVVDMVCGDKLVLGDKLYGTSSDNRLRMSEDPFDSGSHVYKDEKVRLGIAFLDCPDIQDACISPEFLHGHLQECVFENDLQLGIRTHCLITSIGLELEALLGSQLIQMYAHFEQLHEADRVFCTLAAPDVFCWTAIISAHGKLGQAQQAIFLYFQMLKLEVEPDGHAYVAALKACTNADCIAEGRQIHSRVIAADFELNDFVGSTLIEMYMKCGFLQDACVFFTKLPTQNIVMWSTLIVGHTNHGYGDVALNLFDKMYQQGIEPNHILYGCILKTCASLSALDQGMKVHNSIIECGFEYDGIVGNALIDMYAKCGSIEKAHSLFQKNPQRNLVTWSTLMGGCTQNGYDWEALELFEAMEMEGVVPDRLAFTCLLKACANAPALSQGRKIHSCIIERGWESDLFITSTLVEVYTECGCLLDAQVVFYKAPSRDIVTWNVLISGCAMQEAWMLFMRMQDECPEVDPSSFVCLLKACSGNLTLAEGRELHADAVSKGFELDASVSCSLIDMYIKCGSIKNAHLIFTRALCRDVVTWSALIVGYSQLGETISALHLFDQMQNANIEPNEVTFIAILKACSLCSALEQGRLVHGWTIRSGLDRDTFVGNSLVDMYAKCGSLAEASVVFNRLLLQDVVTWSALIAGYAELGQGREAVCVFHQMQQAGIDPNEASYISVLKACHSTCPLSDSKLIHGHIIEDGFVSDLFVCNTLVDVYAECGNLKDACMLFNRMLSRDTITWNALIRGHAKHGFGQEALRIFQQMLHESLEPDQSTFVFILKACAMTLALQNGREIHGYISERGWESDVYVGSSLIDMYSKCGNLTDASMVFERSAHRDTVVWSSMIAAYAQHNDYDSCSLYFRAMVEESLVPDSVTYIGLLSACSHACLKEEAFSHLRSMEAEHSITPGIEHFNVVADLLGRSSYLEEAEDLLESLPFGPNTVGWTSLLDSCRKHSDVRMGRRCFEHTTALDAENGTGYVLMSRIYMSLGMLDAAREVEKARQVANIRKLLPRACIEIEKEVHVFTVGDMSHLQNEQILGKLKSLAILSNAEEHFPDLDAGLRSKADRDEDNSCGHCEKLAIAFGLLNMSEGATIRVSKNMRVCEDCHSSTRIISKLERREIIISDTYCVHHFKDGECSCKDYR